MPPIVILNYGDRQVAVGRFEAVSTDHKPPRRPGTILGDRNELRRTPVHGVPVPIEFTEPTGVYEGEDLRRARAQRPTGARLERLEDKHDETRRDVADLRAVVGRIEGKLDVLPQLVEAVQASAERANQREQVTFTASVEVDKAQKIGKVSAKLMDKELGVKLVATGSTIAAIVLALIEARHC